MGQVISCSLQIASASGSGETGGQVRDEEIKKKIKERKKARKVAKRLALLQEEPKPGNG